MKKIFHLLQDGRKSFKFNILFSNFNFSFGETYDTGKHPQGTEIKAITYSNMQIHITPERSDLYVIVDI